MLLTASITKWGNSHGVRLPKTLLELLEWKNDDILEIIVENNQLSIRKREKKGKTIAELFSNYEGEYEKVNIDWGSPVGREFPW